ncbi:MAG TPA: efflux RND transporter periplasmic adaptor subunit [Rhodopila sp.]|nr:efflux RND transporter periplasmic adaptor subunit [Rhodopila sp.]
MDTRQAVRPDKRAEAGPRGGRTPRAALILIALVIVLIALVIAEGILSRRNIEASLARVTEAEAVPNVALVSPERGPAVRPLDLPGTLAAWYEAPIYGQVTGYVSHWYTDYGATVHKGEELATIDTPYLDEQLGKAKANLAVAQARYKLAVTTAHRWQRLSGTDAVSQQEVDVYTADAEARKAEVEAADYNVRRFEARENFKTLVAPFDGIVTARNTDVGSYVDSGGGSANGGEGGGQGHPTALFRVADVHKMRIFVSVPQDYAVHIKPGTTATVSLGHDAGRTFKADVLTTARAVTPSSRTVVTELTTDNADGSLWPGAYVTVHFSVPVDEAIRVVPAQALLFRSEGLLVALVGPDNRVHLQKVTAGLNFGAKVQVLQGLKPDDRIVANPSQGLQEGELVHVVHEAASPPSQQPRNGGKP